MAKLIDDPQHWRRRAAEVRTAAVTQRNLDLKRKLQGMAKELADLADKRARTGLKPTNPISIPLAQNILCEFEYRAHRRKAQSLRLG
jgi:hypothetical protein